jgi:hypothetical protein
MRAAGAPAVRNGRSRNDPVADGALLCPFPVILATIWFIRHGELIMNTS